MFVIILILATSQSLAHFMKEHGYSLKQMKTFQRYIRGTFGPKSVETYAQEKLVKVTHEMDDFFEAKDHEFVEIDNKVQKTVTRTLVVVTDTTELIYNLHEKLNLDVHESTIKVGFDYGGECLKARMESNTVTLRSGLAFSG